MESANEELDKYREYLEKQVMERTAEWAEANARLHREIAARKAAEETLRKSEEHFRSLIENALDIITVLDEKGGIVFESPSIERLLGYRREELIGTKVFDLIHRNDKAVAHAVFTRLLAAPGTTESIELRILHRDGSWRIFEAIGKAIAEGPGAVRIIINSRDVTEHRKLEEDALKAQKLESLGTLAGGIAHDFNNLLTGIMANVDLARLRAAPGDELDTLLAKAEQASLRAKDLTRQLLTFSRGGEPVKKTVQLGDLIRGAAESALRGAGSVCVYSIPCELWPVEADEGQLRQVIHNIVKNADQAMPHGGTIMVLCENVSLGAQEAPVLAPGEYVRISIGDQGVGIPKENLPKIFDPYFTTRQDGRGMGLATAYSIIKKHGGHMAAESEEGAGTTLTFFLPAAVRQSKAARAVSEALPQGAGRILIMDDEEIIRDVASRILQAAGYDVEVAADGDEAIELYRKAKASGRPIDVVILDLTVPGGTGGMTALKGLLEIDPSVRAIVSSGYSHDPIMANYRDYGFLGVIAKPYNIREMSETVRRVMTGGP